VNYYNEFDPFAAAWLEQLIAAGHIAPGVVDRRSIEDVSPNDLKDFKQCHFFAGIGVWSYALRRAGWSDDTPVWTGSCPCQPFSTAGKGTGFDDERHLWPHFHYLIEQCRPSIVFGEQVASKDGLAWLDLVSADLEATGYAFGAADLCAAGVGAPHIRQRSFWVADADNAGPQGHGRHVELDGPQGREAAERHVGTGSVGVSGPLPANGFWGDADWLGCRDGKWRPVEPGTFPLVNGAANRVGRLRGYGNAIVAPVAQIFIESVM
jgi:DNA (cytosine-5)-methyltransferase 1